MQGKDIDTMSDYHVEVMVDGEYAAHYLKSYVSSHKPSSYF